MGTPETTGRPDTPAAGRTVSAIELAEAAAEAVRGLNHATLPNGADGLQYPSGTYRTLRELVTLANRLPQAVQQLRTVMEQQHASRHVEIVAGTRYAAATAAEVGGATVFMQVADQLAVPLGAALGEASEALAYASCSGSDSASYSGPEPGAEAGSEPGR